MTTIDLMTSAQSLPVQEKLLLIQAITQMLHDDFTKATTKHGVQTIAVPAQVAAASIVANSIHEIRTSIEELLNRPNPSPDQMLRAGMFARKMPDLSNL